LLVAVLVDVSAFKRTVHGASRNSQKAGTETHRDRVAREVLVAVLAAAVLLSPASAAHRTTLRKCRRVDAA
jgi:hypothetical protein